MLLLLCWCWWLPAVVTNYHVVSKFVLDKSGQQVGELKD